MITPEALRAARAILGWGVRDLASKSGVAWTTINRFENGRPLRPATGAKLAAALQAAGIELVTEPARTGAILVRPHGGQE